jgi:hypothetical protein
MKSCCFTFAIACAICIALVCARPALSQDPSVEYQIKAAFLYNFAQFVEWPAQAFSRPDAPFTFCLAGDPFKGALEKTIHGETLNGRPLTARRVGPGEDIQGCHVIYIGTSEARRSAEIIAAATKAPILTVGETDDVINAGGIIRFIESGHRIRFAINPDAAERASLKVSSRLLRLADIVRPRGWQ